MYVYGIRNIATGKIISRKAAGGRFYMRAGDAKKKLCDNGSEQVVKFRLVQVDNETYTPGRIHLYQRHHGGKLFSRKDKYWAYDEYITYELIEEPA